MRTTDAVSRRRLILDAARDLLVKRGFQNIVLDDVASAAGVAKGTLFLYYRSKDELFSSAFADLVDQYGDRLDSAAASGKRGLALLTETIRAILNHFERNRDFLSHFGAGKFPACGNRSNGMLMRKFRKNSKKVKEILKTCANDGVLPDKDFTYEAFALVGLCRSAVLAKIVTENKQPLEKDTEKVLNFFLRGARDHS